MNIVRILKQSHSAEKLERGDPSGFLKLQFAGNIKKTFGAHWRQKKTKRQSHSAETNSTGDHIVSSGFVLYFTIKIE